ncbi:MAG TPA: HNH endonuclease [Syntrophales bacterium]|nr:HNH endonuclease [Syntrophales bacterium]
MAKAVFTTKVTPSYNDLPELMYHFPKTYLRQAILAIGDWIVYYEPRRENLSPAGHAGRQCYFATARVTHIKEDVTLQDHYYAFVENYVEFSTPVPFRIGTYYYEKGLQKTDGSTNKGAFGRAVRLIQDEDYQAIVAAGLAQVNEKNYQEVAEPSLTFESKRPVIQQIIERPFREAAFSRLVKEEYGLTCAMTGITIKNDRGITEVEAAHIRPVKFNGPDSVRNGIALCRTFHWMFDHGLISVADSGDIIVKDIVPPKIYHLLNTNGKIRLPSNRTSAPHPIFLKFHREEIYNSSRH